VPTSTLPKKREGASLIAAEVVEMVPARDREQEKQGQEALRDVQRRTER
jgi:hypothetical protein